MNEKRYTKFYDRTIAKTWKSNFLVAAIIFCYSICFLDLTFTQLWQSAVFVISFVIFAEGVLARASTKLLRGKLSEKLEEFENGKMDSVKDRTKLLLDIMKQPINDGIEEAVYFVGCAFILFLWYAFFIKVNLSWNLMSLVACLFGSLCAVLIAINSVQKLCEGIAIKIIAAGVDEKEIEEKPFLGIPLQALYFLFLLLPTVFTAVISFFVSRCPQINWMQALAIILCNAIISLISGYKLFNQIVSYNNIMRNALINMTEKDIRTAELIPTDISNEIAANLYLVNKTILKFRDILAKAGEIAEKVTGSTQDLVVISEETTATALEQASSVKEILATMENSDDLSRTVSSKAGEVAVVASKTTADVESGFDTLRTNLEKMDEITEANMNTISGIKSLCEQIENIQEVVKIINGIADQTKIIAFNAELEAASAGDAGKNFHIVANEIRRLADSTMDSTKEIRSRIQEIQHASDNLIITSEGGTEKIHEGCELSNTLEEKFTNIRTSSEITAESSNEIKEIIEQQTTAFEQIVETLRQISAGVENSSSSTQAMTHAAEQLRGIADTMQNLV